MPPNVLPIRWDLFKGRTPFIFYVPTLMIYTYTPWHSERFIRLDKGTEIYRKHDCWGLRYRDQNDVWLHLSVAVSFSPERGPYRILLQKFHLSRGDFRNDDYLFIPDRGPCPQHTSLLGTSSVAPPSLPSVYRSTEVRNRRVTDVHETSVTTKRRRNYSHSTPQITISKHFYVSTATWKVTPQTR